MNIQRILPVVRLEGSVVKGFGRGSKLLGFPTANLDPKAFEGKLRSADAVLSEGVYAGWVSISGGEVYKTVLSIGFNPYFKNKEQTVETYILHEFADDFYDEHMRLVICAHLRAQQDFQGNMDALIAAIHNDERVGSELLDQEPYAQLKHDAFFTPPPPQ